MSDRADSTRPSPDERLREAAAILAISVLRLRQRAAVAAKEDLEISAKRPPEAPRSARILMVRTLAAERDACNRLFVNTPHAVALRVAFVQRPTERGSKSLSLFPPNTSGNRQEESCYEEGCKRGG
jgi:hypothetical protein